MKIHGYTQLTEAQVAQINAIKEAADGIGELIDALKEQPSTDHRWLAIGQTDLQKGFMAVVRSIAQPESF